jgi:hypothetical protein
LFRSKNLREFDPKRSGKHKRRLTVFVGLRARYRHSDQCVGVEPTPGVMRASNRWVLAGASAGVMLMVVEAVCAERTFDNNWVQAYGRQDKDCLEWNDTCVSCVRAQSGGDYSCSNIGIACQPKEVRCIRHADEKTK